jgi:hypothetical protein
MISSCNSITSSKNSHSTCPIQYYQSIDPQLHTPLMTPTMLPPRSIAQMLYPAPLLMPDLARDLPLNKNPQSTNSGHDRSPAAGANGHTLHEDKNDHLAQAARLANAAIHDLPLHHQPISLMPLPKCCM